MIACGADRAACGRIVPRNAFVAVPCLGRKVHRFPRATHNKPHASSAEPVKLEEVDWDSVDWDTYDWRDYVDDAPGPAFKHTLQALEWEAVCKQIASFASTFVGKKQCQNIEIARTLDRALTLQRETKAVMVLEVYLATSLDFGGISTDAAETALRRANKGGMLTGDLCLGVATLIQGAQGIQSSLKTARSTAKGTGYQEQIEVLVNPFLAKDLPTDIAREVHAAIDDTGNVRDAASDDVKRTRARLATIEGRLRGMLQRHPTGEISTYRGRMCVAVALGESKGGGVVLGAGPAVQYVEPGAAVPLNNDLAAARGEALSAEEAVLWSLTGRIIDAHGILAALLSAVVALDVASARHRYTEWLEGTHVEFTPFPWERRRNGTAAAAAGAGEMGGCDDAQEDVDADAWVLLKRLRHPLLHGWYLQRKAAWKKQQGAMQKQKKPKGAAAAAKAAAEALPEPEPVVPITWRAQAGVRSVIITGPNTGGKTAALKSLGLSVLLAMSGCGVPARAPARLPPFSGVYADIGDSQDLTASLSTFSGHLRRISALREEAVDGRALVLLDEVGTGTDPDEGTALGAALLERLAEGGPGGAALTASTTHMAALTNLKFEDPRFENASAEFDEATLAPTYRLLWGVPGRSNALNIASRLGLPREIIDEAREVWGASQARMDSLVDELEAVRGDVETSEAAVEAAEARLRTLEADVAAARAEAAALQAEVDVTRSAVVGPAIDSAIKRLRRLQKVQEQEKREAEDAQAQAAAAAKTKKKKAAAVAKGRKQQAEQGWKPAVGDLVDVPKLGTSARVEQVKGKKVTVAFGQMSMTVSLSEVLRMD